MTIKVNFSKAGMGIDEGMVLRWLKSVGDRVKEGEPLVEVENAKAVQEIAAPAAGRLSKILIPEGETARVNTALALIEEDLD